MTTGARVWRRSLACVLACLPWLVGCESAPATQGGTATLASRTVVSPGMARAIAWTLRAEAGGGVQDGVVPRRVARLGQRFAKAGAVRLASVTILATAEPIARALPGGHVQLSRGLIAALADEDPAQPLVASVLAHCVAQETLGQPRASLWAGLQAGGVARLTSAVSPFLKAEVAGAPDVGLALRLVRERALTPEERRAADRQAVRLLARAGYAPRALAQAYSRLADHERRRPRWIAAWTRAHASAAPRVAEAEAAAAELGRLPALRETQLEIDLSRLKADDALQARAEAALELVRSGRAPKALLSAEDRRSPEGQWVELVARARRAGEHKGFERDVRRLLVRRPRHAGARLLLARLYASEERDDAAREELLRVLAGAPFLAPVHLELAQLDSNPKRLGIARDLDQPAAWVSVAAERALAGPRTSGPRERQQQRRRLLSGSY